MTIMPNPMAKLDLLDDRAEIELAEHSAVIKALGKRVVTDVIEIGARLTKCKGIAGHGNWLAWLDREFGWSTTTAEKFIRVATVLGSNSKEPLNLELSFDGLYLLCAKSTPGDVRTEVLDRAANGEQLTHAQVKEMIAASKAEVAADNIRELERLRKEYDQREAELRESYKHKIVFDDQSEALEWVTKQMAPLQEQITALEKQIEKYKSREERDRKKLTPEAKQELNLSLAATGVISEAELFVQHLERISVEQIIENEKKATDVTGETLLDRLGQTLVHAKIIARWAAEFIDVMEPVDE